MRTTFIGVLLTLLAAGAAAGDLAAARQWTHTRPLTRGTTKVLADAARSSIVADLLEDLERTDVITYVTDSTTGGEAGPPAYLMFVSYAAATRYLLVHIDPCWRVPMSERIAQLAHELQHALEVARAPEVRDAASLAELYRRIGWEGHHGRFESVEAVAVGNRVRNQLAGFGR